MSISGGQSGVRSGPIIIDVPAVGLVGSWWCITCASPTVSAVDDVVDENADKKNMVDDDDDDVSHSDSLFARF
jgi:hypothetical protein